MMYKVIRDQDFEYFQMEVSKAISSGWVVTGGIAVESWDGINVYYQAMTWRGV